MSDPKPNPSDPARLTHIDAVGKASMVDVGHKPATARTAVAEGRVRISDELAERIAANDLAKGSLLETARLAGVMAAKRTDTLIPLCHSLPLDHVDVQVWVEAGCVRLRALASTTARTGVEMEAFTAVCIAALTVIDMGKAVDPAMVIEDIRLIEKRGGKRGTVRPHDDPTDPTDG